MNLWHTTVQVRTCNIQPPTTYAAKVARECSHWLSCYRSSIHALLLNTKITAHWGQYPASKRDLSWRHELLQLPWWVRKHSFQSTLLLCATPNDLPTASNAWSASPCTNPFPTQQADNLQTSESLKKKSCGASIVAYWLSIPRCCWCHSSRNALLNFNYLAWSSRSSRVSLLLFLALRKNSSQRMKATDSVEANQMTYSSAQFSITKEVPCVSFPSLSLLTIGA